MEEFWKAAAIVILSVILGAAIGKTEKDISVVLSAVTCCIVAATAMRYLSDVVAFLLQLNAVSDRGIPFLEQILRITGVALLTELICVISSDAGNASLGKAMQMLGNAVIFVQAIPVFDAFLKIIQDVLRYA